MTRERIIHLRLLDRVGTDMMTHLLTNTSIFAPLENDCLCQLTGKPIIYHKLPTAPVAQSSSTPPLASTGLARKRTNESTDHDERSTKRLKLANGLASRPNSFERLRSDMGDKRRQVRYCWSIHVSYLTTVAAPLISFLSASGCSMLVRASCRILEPSQ